MMIISIILITSVILFMYKYQESNELKVCRVRDNSLNILNERFSRGEISEEEYYSIKNALNR
ncbi:hypothetical protein [uncultured Clostridium sp.]|uniref:hypothetical protein n=1 Tax=uncultured Clostridium sp. TaxID=59620 RepID=UPI0028EF26C1|nr:hypothetical protein [uncultured Clostridium sp.]